MRSTVPAQAHQPPGDDGPTLMFQRGRPGHGERCTLCPFHPASAATPRHPAASPRGPASAPPARLPRPALLPADLRGSGTLVLPDVLRAAGPDAATIERPLDAGPHPIDTRRDAPRHRGRAARDPDFDELASPDITVLQPTAPPIGHQARPIRTRPPARPPARAYLAVNICLGLLIVAGLALLALRDSPSTPPSASANE